MEPQLLQTDKEHSPEHHTAGGSVSPDAAMNANYSDLSVFVCLPGDLNCIAGATSRNGAFIWDVRKGKIITRFNEVTSLCFHPHTHPPFVDSLA